MATATTPVTSQSSYPAEAVARLFAPPESEVPADKLRRILHEARAAKSFVHTAGAYDAFTSAIMTSLGFKALYGSGWQLAATRSMYPDIGIYQSHQMVELVLEMRKGIEGARNTRWYDSEGKEKLSAPPAFVDMEAGFGGPTQTFTLATELIRVGAGGVHLENQDPSNRTCGHIVNVGKQKRNKVLVPRAAWLAKLKAIKAAAEATGVDIVIIARTDSIDGALPDQEPGGVKMAIDDALEAAELGVDVIWPEFNNTEIDQPQEFSEGVRKHYPDQMLGLQPLALALLREGQEGRHHDHQPAARRPRVHPAVLDAVQLPDGRHGAGEGPSQVPEQRHRRARGFADRGGQPGGLADDEDAPEVRRHEPVADSGAGAERKMTEK